MAVRPTEAITIIPQYNIEPYDEIANPYGFDDGGHIYNHLQSFRYVVQIENYLTTLSGEMEDAVAAATAAFAVERVAAETAREGADAAQGLAEGFASAAAASAGDAADSAAAAAASAGSVDAAAIDARLDAVEGDVATDDGRLQVIEADDWVTRARIADAVFATPAEIKQATDKVVTASAENEANAIYNVPFTSTIVLDGNNGRVQRITATGNFTLGLPTNLKNGRYELEVVSSGGVRTMSFATGWRFAKGKLATLTQVSGAVDVFLIRPNGSTPAIVPTAFLDLKTPV